VSTGKYIFHILMLLESCKFTIGKLNTREHTCYLLPNLLLPPLSGAPLKYLQCNPLSSNLQTNTLKPYSRETSFYIHTWEFCRFIGNGNRQYVFYISHYNNVCYSFIATVLFFLITFMKLKWMFRNQLSAQRTWWSRPLTYWPQNE
jgi:hypothetical protein